MKVPFFKASLGKEEKDAVTRVLDSGWLTTGPVTLELEQEFARRVQAPYALAVSSATAGATLIFHALQLLYKTKSVLFPIMTFGSIPAEAYHLGYGVQFTDIDTHTLNINVDKLFPADVICVTHMAGMSCDLEAIYSYAEKHGLLVVEDAAHAFPATYDGVPIGGDARSKAVFYSFYATKTVTCGEGGMVVTHDRQLYDLMYKLRLHGFDRSAFDRYRLSGRAAADYDIVFPGHKSNLPDILSAIALEQVKKAESLRKKRKQVVSWYDQKFESSSVAPLIQHTEDSACHLYIVLADGQIAIRDKLMDFLSDRGIGTSIHFKPLSKHSFWIDKVGEADFCGAEYAYRFIMSLPLWPDMSEKEVDYVVQAINDYVSAA